MGLFDNKEFVKVIKLNEDYTARAIDVGVDRASSEIITQKKNGKRYMSHLLIHQLMKPIYGYPGVADGTKVLLITSRDVRFDPLGQLDESWNDENIRSKMTEIAKEQQYKVEKSNSGSMGTATILLAVSALILFVALAIIGLIKYRGGI